MSEIDRRIEEVEKDLKELKDIVSDFKNWRWEIEKEIDRLESQIGDVKSELERLRSYVSSLESEMRRV